MSNENQGGNMNEQGGSGKTDPNRATEAPKTGQQSQDLPRTDKGASQQGGSDQKSGQQSQGGSPKESDAKQQAGSPKVI
jgi:hypothetical protein